MFEAKINKYGKMLNNLYTHSCIFNYGYECNGKYIIKLNYEYLLTNDEIWELKCTRFSEYYNYVFNYFVIKKIMYDFVVVSPLLIEKSLFYKKTLSSVIPFKYVYCEDSKYDTILPVFVFDGNGVDMNELCGSFTLSSFHIDNENVDIMYKNFILIIDNMIKDKILNHGLLELEE